MQQIPENLTHIPVDRITLLKMVNKAKNRQTDEEPEWEEQRDKYIAGILATLERVAHNITGDEVWEASAPDGTLTLIIPPTSEKPKVRVDWNRLERIYQLDTREQVLVPTKLLNILIEENDNE